MPTRRRHAKHHHKKSSRSRHSRRTRRRSGGGFFDNFFKVSDRSARKYNITQRQEEELWKNLSEFKTSRECITPAQLAMVGRMRIKCDKTNNKIWKRLHNDQCKTIDQIYKYQKLEDKNFNKKECPEAFLTSVSVLDQQNPAYD